MAWTVPGGQLALLDLLPILFVGGDLAGNQLSPAGPVWPPSVSLGMISNWLYGDPPRVLPGATIAPERREEIHSHPERILTNITCQVSYSAENSILMFMQLERKKKRCWNERSPWRASIQFTSRMSRNNPFHLPEPPGVSLRHTALFSSLNLPFSFKIPWFEQLTELSLTMNHIILSSFHTNDSRMRNGEKHYTIRGT